MQVFGLSEGNARSLLELALPGRMPDLPQTRAMLMRACDVRLPTRLTGPELDFIAGAVLAAVREVKG